MDTAKREILLKKKHELSTAQIIALGFFLTILVGSILLCLPICAADGRWTCYLDALFTSTTSVCVTGLVVVDTYAHWSVFGQVVILLLIQCGGLGIITLSTFVMVLIGRKVSLKDRLLLEDAFNLDTLQGLVRFLKKGIKRYGSGGRNRCTLLHVRVYSGIWSKGYLVFGV